MQGKKKPCSGNMKHGAFIKYGSSEQTKKCVNAWSEQDKHMDGRLKILKPHRINSSRQTDAG
jgi:hypothetical protein